MTDVDRPVKIKHDEQVRQRKRKRPETEAIKKKKKKLRELKEAQQKIKEHDRATESQWSMISIEEEKELLSMGLASLEVIEDYNFEIERPGKRLKKTGPKTTQSPSDSKNTKSNKEKTVQLKSKPLKCETKEDSNATKSDSSSDHKTKETDTSANKTSEDKISARQLSIAEKKLRIKLKRKEKIVQSRLKRKDNLNEEKERLRKDKQKAKRKAKKLAKIQAKALANEVQEHFQKTEQKSEALSESIIEAPSQPTETKISSRPLDSKVTESLVDDTTEQTVVHNEKASLSDPVDPDVTDQETVVTPPVQEAVTLSDTERESGKQWLALNVCEALVKGLVELGFTTPTPIQQACIPAGLLTYKDVVGTAETGSGKTLAFGIPLLQRVMLLKAAGRVQGLILCPTRELALQVAEHLTAAAKYTSVKIVSLVGGMAAPKQLRLLSYHPPVLVATPGRLWYHIQNTAYLQDLSSVKFLVVDEADRMVEDGHFQEVTDIIGRLPGPEKRNTYLFSATLSFTINKLDDKAKKNKKEKKKEKKSLKKNGGLELLVKNIGIKEKVEKIDLSRKKGTAELLKETYLLSNVEDKDAHLYYLLLNHPGKILVFANSIDGVMNLVHITKLLQLPVHPLHSALQQRQRLKFLDRFKENAHAVLICTDVAARGLDIPEVDTVIHYQLPVTKQAYIHRSGRTARALNPGLSVALVGPKDFKSYKGLSSQMTEFPLEHSRLRYLRPPLQIARQIFKLERLKSRPDKREAKLFSLAQAADLDPEIEKGEDGDTKKQVKILKAQLIQLLGQPVVDPLSNRYIASQGGGQSFQTLSNFSLGTTALDHSTGKKRKK